MGSPLFPNFNRFTRAQLQALAKWAASQDRGSSRGNSRGGGSGRSTQTTRGSSGRGDDWLWNAVLSRLGPLGEVVDALLRPHGRPASPVQRELAAAQELLEAFGFVVNHPGRTGRQPAQGEPVDEGPTSQEIREQRRSRPAGTEPQQPEAPTSPEPARPLVEGMILVKSSNVHSIGFEWNPAGDHLPGNLLVRFLAGMGSHRAGPGPLYRYRDVPREVFVRFKLAASKGGYVWDELRIRGSIIAHQYDYDLAGTGDDGYIPRQVGFKRGQKGEYYLQRQHGGRRSTLPERHVRGGRGSLSPGFDRKVTGVKFRAGRKS